MPIRSNELRAPTNRLAQLSCTTLLALLAVALVAAQTTPQKPAQQPTRQAKPAGPDQSANNVCMVYFITPKPGSQTQFETALKEHMQWHRQQNDDWTWSVSQTVVGDVGTYVAASCGHNWSDFDTAAKRMEADEQNAMQTMGPHIASVRNELYVVRADLSGSEQPNPSDSETRPLSSIVVFRLKPGQEEAFVDAVKRVRSALQRTNAARNAVWVQMVSGGHGPMFVLIRPLKGFAEMGGTNTMQILTAAVGEQQARQLLGAVRDKAEEIYTSMNRDRPDLSYKPVAAAQR